MVEDAVGELGFSKELVNFMDILPYFAEVKRTEVLVEGVVGQILSGGADTLSILKKNDLGLSLGGLLSAMK